MGLGFKLRGIYSRPWSQIGKNMTFSQAFLKKIGRILVKEVVKEAKKQRKAQGNRSTPRGEPEGLPKGPDFYKSFYYKLRGRSTIEIWSDWPVIEQLIEGRDAYRMTWFTHEAGRSHMKMKQGSGKFKGTILVRTTPQKRKDAWIHPGFAKHDFIVKGVDKAQEQVIKLITVEVAKKLAKGDPMR